MADLQFPNFGNALTSGLQARAQIDQNDQTQRRRALAPDVQAAIGGDSGALGRVAAVDPDYALKIGPILDRMDANKQAMVERTSKWVTQAGMGILTAPPEQKAAAWDAAVAEAKRLGYHSDKWPQQWGPQAEGFIRFEVGKTLPFTKFFEEQEKSKREGITFEPPGGAPQAAGGTARTGQLESGGSYTAVNGMGSGAYGKYQFMPDTWAAVRQARPELGLPVDMRQATPQQQEASKAALDQLNGRDLTAAGHQPNDANLYLAHRFGAQGAQTFLTAPDNAPIAAIFPPSWIQQNPDLQNKTVGQFKQFVAQNFPPSAGGPQQATGPPVPLGPQPTMGTTPAPITASGANSVPMPPQPAGLVPPGPPPAQMPQPQIAQARTPSGTAIDTSIPPPPFMPQGGDQPTGNQPGVMPQPAAGPPPPETLEQYVQRNYPGAQIGRTAKGIAYDHAGRIQIKLPNGQVGTIAPPSAKEHNLPVGYEARPGGGLQPISGGPADLDRKKTDLGITPDNEKLTGEEFLKTLPTGDRDIVQGLLSGRILPADLSKRAQDYTRYMALAMHADKAFDPGEGGARRRFETQFMVNGQGGQTMLAVNTASQHMDTYRNLMEALNSGSSPLVNKALNLVRSQLGDSAATNADTAKIVLGTEIAKAVRGAGALNQQEQEEYAKRLSTAASPQQAQGTLQVLTELMLGRARSIEDQARMRGVPEDRVNSYMSPRAREALKHITDTPIQGSQEKSFWDRNVAPIFQPRSAAPAPASPVDQGRAQFDVNNAGEGATGTTPDGQKWIKKNGAWGPLQ